MRLLLYSLVSGILVFAVVQSGLAQTPIAAEAPILPPLVRVNAAPTQYLPPPVPINATPTQYLSHLVPLATPSPIAPVNPAVGQELETRLAEIKSLRAQQVALLASAQDDDLKKKVEILEKQIETLEKLIKLVAEQVKKQPASGAAVEQLQTQGATLEARSVQAARRDSELADAVDDLREHLDAQERYGPMLPAPLKELFLPSGNSETPLSIYGALSFGYSKFTGNPNTAANGAGRPATPGGFYFGEFTPDFLLKLNDWIFLEAEIGIGGDGSVSAGSFAQADFFVNDALTIIAGRYVVPIGFYNERLNNPWINKLPGDAPGGAPLPFLQVLPPLAGLGVQAAGAFYIGCSPIKMEYNLYVTNGLNVTPATAGAPTVDELANLENMESTFASITNNLAYGGRLGFWWPECGLAGGFSALHSSDYISGFDNAINLWAVDLNYHKGNWDARAEYGMTYQQAQPFLPTDITRQGFYAQIAYRPRDCSNPYLQNVELVYRYCHAHFDGLDPTTLDLTTYSTPVDVPVNRQQNEVGINYYFAPRMVLKCAFQINDEPKFHLHDNQFLAELDWGW